MFSVDNPLNKTPSDEVDTALRSNAEFSFEDEYHPILETAAF